MRTLPSPVPPAIAGRPPRIAGPGPSPSARSCAGKARPVLAMHQLTAWQQAWGAGSSGLVPAQQTKRTNPRSRRCHWSRDAPRRPPSPCQGPRRAGAPHCPSIFASRRRAGPAVVAPAPDHARGELHAGWWLPDVSTPMAPRTPGTRTGTGEALPTRPASPGRCSQCCFPSPWESGTNYRPFGSPPTTQSVRAQCAAQSHALHTLIRRPEAGSRPGTRSRRPRRPTRGRGGSPMSAARRCLAWPGREPGRTPQPR